MALTNAEKQKAWRERRNAYIQRLEARIAELELERQQKGKRSRPVDKVDKNGSAKRRGRK